jgi:hypothetical protein
MAEVVIYKQDSGVISVFYPSADFAGSLAAIAPTVVPTGKPYKIIDSADLPADRTQRLGWTVDDAELTDGVGA